MGNCMDITKKNEKGEQRVLNQEVRHESILLGRAPQCHQTTESLTPAVPISKLNKATGEFPVETSVTADITTR